MCLHKLSVTLGYAQVQHNHQVTENVTAYAVSLGMQTEGKLPYYNNSLCILFNFIKIPAFQS